MGKMVEGVLASRNIERAGKSEDIQSADTSVTKDCICIDFTVPDAFRANYKFIAENFRAAVVGTTGWYDIADEVFDYFQKCGTTLIWASNFSIGVNVFTAAVDIASRLLGKAGGYAPYIVRSIIATSWMRLAELPRHWRPALTGTCRRRRISRP